jgi:hypothetical protein
MERSGTKRVPKPAKSVRDKYRIGGPGAHNESTHAARSASYEFERVTDERPSRKQTRKSHNRQKTDSALKTTKMSQMTAPSARATRRAR